MLVHGIDCRLADMGSRERIGNYLSGRVPFSFNLVGDVMFGWLFKPEATVDYDQECPVAGRGRLAGGMTGGRGARILKKGATSDVLRALREDVLGMYRVWALES